MAHGQKIRKQPRALLAQIPGLKVVELHEADWCCGSAGTYNLTQPEMAARLQERKVHNIRATGADAVVTANPGLHHPDRAGPRASAASPCRCSTSWSCSTRPIPRYRDEDQGDGPRRAAAADAHPRHRERDDVVVSVALSGGGDEILAIGNECPHQGGNLCDGWIEGEIVTCPLHGWEFDLRSGVCMTVPGERVPGYRVTVEDGAVHLEAVE